MPGRPIVLDASTAILLAKIDLLRDVALHGEVWMAEIAFREATVKQVDDARMIRRLLDEGLLKRAAPSDDGRRWSADFRLDAGEAETIALAREMGAIAGTDDGAAIRCLRVLGQPYTSAVALLVAAAENGRVTPESARERLDRLERFGRYHPRILEEAARKIRSVQGGTR